MYGLFIGGPKTVLNHILRNPSFEKQEDYCPLILVIPVKRVLAFTRCSTSTRKREWGEGNLWIIRNIGFWPDSFTMFMGNLSWVVPVEKALAGERIALMSPTLVST